MHRTFAEFLAADEIYERLYKDIELDDVEGMEAWWEDFDYLLGMETLNDQALWFIKYKITASEADGDKIVNTLCNWFFETYLPAGMLYRSGRETGESSIEKSYVLLASYCSIVKTINPKIACKIASESKELLLSTTECSDLLKSIINQRNSSRNNNPSL